MGVLVCWLATAPLVPMAPARYYLPGATLARVYPALTVAAASPRSQPRGLVLGDSNLRSPSRRRAEDPRLPGDRPTLAPFPVLLATLITPLGFFLAHRHLHPQTPLDRRAEMTILATLGTGDLAVGTAKGADATATVSLGPKSEFEPVLEGDNVVFERDPDGVVMLSYGKGSPLWMGFSNPNAPLDFGLQYFKSQAALMLCSGPHSRVLMLGLGIGALPATLRALHPTTHIDVVEIDAEVIDGVTRFLSLGQDDRLRLHHADAAAFVQREECQGQYDFILLDCFDGSGIPAVFHNFAFYQDAVRCLKPTGTFSINLIYTHKEALQIRGHLLQLLHSPRVLFSGDSTNCACFGAASPDGEAALSLDAMKTAAARYDAQHLLPYPLLPEVERIRDVPPHWRPT